MASKTTVFVSTNDVPSLIILFGITGNLKPEANLYFDKNRFGMHFSTDDNMAMIEFESNEKQLLNYYYDDSVLKRTYIGVCLKVCYMMLRSIPAKSVGQIYKVERDEELYLNCEGSTSYDGASKIHTINLPVDVIEPPQIRDTDVYVKVNNSDFSNMCSAFIKSDCKRIKFTIRKNVLYIRGFNEYGECRSARSFRNSSPNEEETDDIIDDCEPTKVKKGKLSITIKKKIPSDQYSVETTIDKLKPLTKINSLCKNGIVYVYVCEQEGSDKRENIIILKTNVGQIGTFGVYLRDATIER